jgi:hypothetical protein
MKQTTRDSKMDGSTSDFGAFDEDRLERLLREDAARQPHIEDGGFSTRVMQQLPTLPGPAPRWLTLVMTVLGCAIALFLTPAGEYFARNMVALFDFSHFSWSHLSVLVPVAVIYVCSFAAARE